MDINEDLNALDVARGREQAAIADLVAAIKARLRAEEVVREIIRDTE